MNKLAYFPQNRLTPIIGQGENGKVFAISKDYAAKVPLFVFGFGRNAKLRQTLNDPSTSFGKRLLNEYSTYQEMHNAGISVPKQEGVYKVEIIWFETFFGLYYPQKSAIVMERIHGIGCNLASGDLRKRVEELHRIEIEKCNRLGFYSAGERSLGNSMYSPKENRLYIVDAGHFKRK